MQQDAIFSSGKQTHNQKNQIHVTPCCEEHQNLFCTCAKKPQETQCLAGGRCRMVFPSFSVDLCSWTVEQSQQLATKKKKKRKLAQTRIEALVGREKESHHGFYLQHQQGQVQCCLNKGREGLLSLLLKPQLHRISITLTLKD